MRIWSLIRGRNHHACHACVYIRVHKTLTPWAHVTVHKLTTKQKKLVTTALSQSTASQGSSANSRRYRSCHLLDIRQRRLHSVGHNPEQAWIVPPEAQPRVCTRLVLHAMRAQSWRVRACIIRPYAVAIVSAFKQIHSRAAHQHRSQGPGSGGCVEK